MKGIRVVLLCEDKQLSVFARRFLKNRGYSDNVFEIPRPPEAEVGSRKQWVTRQYPEQLKYVRKRSGAVLVVCTDADELTVDRRLEELDEACKQSNLPPRTADDPVVMIIPKWNIETWLAYLRGESFDENRKENRRYRNEESRCQTQIQRLVTMCYEEQKLQEPAPPSLECACREYRKLKQYKHRP